MSASGIPRAVAVRDLGEAEDVVLCPTLACGEYPYQAAVLLGEAFQQRIVEHLIKMCL